MNRAVLTIRRRSGRALHEAGKRITAAWKSGRAGIHTFAFESPSALFRTITPKRWELVERLQSTGPSSIRGLARELDRDVKRVHDDVTALIALGLVARTPNGRVQVPYDVIHADFDLRRPDAA